MKTGFVSKKSCIIAKYIYKNLFIMRCQKRWKCLVLLTLLIKYKELRNYYLIAIYKYKFMFESLIKGYAKFKDRDSDN